MTHEEFIKKYGIGEIINGVLVISKGLKNSGEVDLSNLAVLPEHTTFNNGGGVYLNNLAVLPEHTTFNNGEGVYLSNLAVLPEHTTFNNGGWVDLSNLSVLAEHTTFNNGGGVYLRNLTMPETLHFFQNWGNVIFKNDRLPPPKDMERNGHEPVIVCDGIRGEVINRKKNIIKLRLHDGEVCFLVTDGNGLYAHGDTIKEAKEELIYKIKGGDTVDSYKALTIDSVLTLPEAIKCYRVITGACSFGVKNFIERNNLKDTQEITIERIIVITNGSYGHDTFKSFFKQSN